MSYLLKNNHSLKNPAPLNLNVKIIPFDCFQLTTFYFQKALKIITPTLYAANKIRILTHTLQANSHSVTLLQVIKWSEFPHIMRILNS